MSNITNDDAYLCPIGRILLSFTEKKVNKEAGKDFRYIALPVRNSFLQERIKEIFQLPIIYISDFSERLISLGFISIIPNLLAISLPYIKLKICMGLQSFSFFLL